MDGRCVSVDWVDRVWGAVDTVGGIVDDTVTLSELASRTPPDMAVSWREDCARWTGTREDKVGDGGDATTTVFRGGNSGGGDDSVRGATSGGMILEGGGGGGVEGEWRCTLSLCRDGLWSWRNLRGGSTGGSAADAPSIDDSDAVLGSDSLSLCVIQNRVPGGVSGTELSSCGDCGITATHRCGISMTTGLDERCLMRRDVTTNCAVAGSVTLVVAGASLKGAPLWCALLNRKL
jgi:hypothetical protein